MVYIKEKESEFKKELSLFDLIMIGIGSTIGVGIFVLIGAGFEIAGPAIILSFIIGCIITFIVTLNYAELGSSIPIAGGGYSYVKEAVTGITPFYVGWLIWLGNIVYVALSAWGITQYISIFIPLILPEIFASLIVVLFMIVNLMGSKESVKIQRLITGSLLVLFTIFILFGSKKLDFSRLDPFVPFGLGSIMITTALTFVCFVGFTSITTVSAEAKNPKDIPKALIISILIAGLIYTLMTLVTVGGLSSEALKESSAPLFSLVKENRLMIIIIFLAMALATLSSLNVGIMASSRNLYALSRDGYMPKILSRLHPKYRAPQFAVILSAFLAILFIGTRATGFIASVSGFGFLVSFSFICLSLYILRIKRKKLDRPFKLPFYKYFSFGGALLSFILIPFIRHEAIFIGVIWMFIGFFVYTLHTLGIDRFRLAFAGINILISVLSFYFWFHLKFISVELRPLTNVFLDYISLIIGFICLIIAVLFIKKIRTQD